MKKFGLIFALFGCLSLMNCSKSKDDLKFMYNLKESITNEFNTDQIKVKVKQDENNIY